MKRRTFIHTGIGAGAIGLGSVSVLAQVDNERAKSKAEFSPPSADFKLIPKRTAFINVDLQNCFVENSPVAAPNGLALLHRLNDFAKVCRAAGVR